MEMWRVWCNNAIPTPEIECTIFFMQLNLAVVIVAASSSSSFIDYSIVIFLTFQTKGT